MDDRWPVRGRNSWLSDRNYTCSTLKWQKVYRNILYGFTCNRLWKLLSSKSNIRPFLWVRVWSRKSIKHNGCWQIIRVKEGLSLSPTDMRENDLMRAMVRKKFILPHFCISHLDRGKRILKWELFWLSLTSWPAANRELELIYYWWWLTSSCSKPLQGKTGKTPLKCVASSGHQDVVELLLNVGASKETVQVYPE